MKHLYYFSFGFAGLLLAMVYNPSVVVNKKEVQVQFTMTNCEKMDSVFLFEFNGVGFEKIGSTPVSEDKATFSIEKSSPRFLYFGLKENDLRPLIVGKEDEVLVEGDCTSGFRSANIKVSELNQAYEAFKFKMTGFANETGALARKFQMSQNDEKAKEDLTLKFADLDARKLDYYKELKKDNPYLAKIFALNTYLSFQNNGNKYANEVEYFANEYFSLVDWKDSDLNNLPWVYESMKSYATTLSRINLPADLHQNYLEGTLAKIPQDSKTYQFAMGGVITALEQANHSNFAYFGKKFVDKYKDELPEVSRAIEMKIKQVGSTNQGGEAPDFTMNQVDGSPLSLSEFRGKVTLIDFWASWCGPCRRENPHVVELYEKYHGKGFEILGVSLDRSKDKWEQAIAQDGLVWKHVSDLKGWQNEVAQLYGVRSIPHTVLLDAEGKIIARGLRSKALEAELVKIFGK
ncbi:MAG: TlpA disulfide reductase family protein [Saprospiraceae bacterium]